MSWHVKMLAVKTVNISANICQRVEQPDEKHDCDFSLGSIKFFELKKLF